MGEESVIAGGAIKEIRRQYTGVYDGQDGVAFCRHHVVVDECDVLGAVIEYCGKWRVYRVWY
jgi:hypothetical protein